MNTLIDKFINLFDYGPFFLIILSWMVLWNKNSLFFYYTIGIFINTLINLILKGIIKQPRPLDDPRKFNLALTHGKRFLYQNGIPYDIFGMPSGHSQSVMFSTAFMYFALKNKSNKESDQISVAKTKSITTTPYINPIMLSSIV
jgi:membrane-associated phospholipid phosphatase